MAGFLLYQSDEGRKAFKLLLCKSLILLICSCKMCQNPLCLNLPHCKELLYKGKSSFIRCDPNSAHTCVHLHMDYCFLVYPLLLQFPDGLCKLHERILPEYRHSDIFPYQFLIAVGKCIPKNQDHFPHPRFPKSQCFLCCCHSITTYFLKLLQLSCDRHCAMSVSIRLYHTDQLYPLLHIGLYMLHIPDQCVQIDLCIYPLIFFLHDQILFSLSAVSSFSSSFSSAEMSDASIPRFPCFSAAISPASPWRNTPQHAA